MPKRNRSDDYLNDEGLLRDLAARLDDDDDDGDDDEKGEGEAGEKGIALVMRLMKSRTIFVARGISDRLYERVATQLTILEQMDADKPIHVYVNSPGGSADSGFAIYDAMRFVKPPIYTICNGICASAAVIIFLAAQPGKRFSLPNSRFLLHQPSTMSRGQATDLEITAKEIMKVRQRYNKIVAEATGRSVDDVTKDADRDFWLDAEEAVEYRLVDHIVANKGDVT